MVVDRLPLPYDASVEQGFPTTMTLTSRRGAIRRSYDTAWLVAPEAAVRLLESVVDFILDAFVLAHLSPSIPHHGRTRRMMMDMFLLLLS